jgi:hypothetical protein
VTPRLERLPADQPEVRFVDEGRSIEGVARRFGGHPRGGELPQLVVHERQQVGRGLAIAGLGRREEERHVGHSAEFNDDITAGNSKRKLEISTAAGRVRPTRRLDSQRDVGAATLRLGFNSLH